MAEILIVDDDLHLRQSFEKLLAGEGHTVRAASTGEAGIKLVKEHSPDLVVMDVRMPGMDGLTAFTAMRKIDPKLPVIIMTAFGTTETAIEATRMGAFDYVLKPFDIPAVLDLIKRAVEAGKVMRGRVGLGPEEARGPGEMLVGVSRAMNEVYKAIGRAAPTDALVLIRGESGTGKELVARAVYHYSQRASAPFLVINCVAIPETLLESELFGYEKGAFTGAVNRRVGKIEQANHGTVFLDEIGDMPLSIQAKILRLLQEKKIERLGGREPIPVDVRILAATNRDLEAAVAEGRFREDLDMPSPGLTPGAVEALSAHNWPGNVRELANALHKALIFSRGAPLTPEDVLAVTGGRAGGGTAETGEGLAAFIRRTLSEQAGENAFDQLMDHVGRLVIREALEITGGNRTRAARLLGLSRPTLLARIEKYGLKIGAQVS